jgi:RHS repeat-associated protein
MKLQTSRGFKMAILLAALLAHPFVSVATPPGPSGANTGDGSTPFTGLALAPEANLFAGAASVSIPLEVPPGRGGLTPNLALTYNSSARRSPYGYGWDLPLGTIQRCLKHGVPSCSDPTHRNEFVLSLPTGTVECTLGPDNRCLPRLEESFLRIEHDGADNRWDVWDRDGRKYTFGNVAEARTGSDVGSLFQDEIPASGGQTYVPCRYTFSWALTRVEDTNGNVLTIAYVKAKEILYPQAIHYGGNSLGGLEPVFSIDFGWESYTEPGPVQAIAGFPAEISKRLRHIEVSYQGSLVRRYEFAYHPLFTSDRELQFLRDVKLSSAAGPLLNAAQQPARTTFLYRRDQPAFGFALGVSSPSVSVDEPWRLRIENQSSFSAGIVRDIFDINGDAIPDLVDMSQCNSWSFYPGSSAGFAGEPTTWAFSGCWFIRRRDTRGGVSHVTEETLDLNGDGIPDHIDAAPVCVGTTCTYDTWKVNFGYLDGNGGGGFEETSFAWPKPPDLEDAYTRRTVVHPLNSSLAGWTAPVVTYRDLLDMNADGLPDLVSTETGSWRVWLNTGAGFEPAPQPGFSGPYPFLRLSANGNEMIGVYDVNGDGLPDQVAGCDRDAHAGSCPVGPFGGPLWEIYLNTGRGISSQRQQWTFGTNFAGPGIRRVSGDKVVRDFFDITGDGLPDVVDIPTGLNWNVYINAGFNFRTQAAIWVAGSGRIRDTGADGATEKDTFDIDGDGLVDFVDFDPAGNNASTTMTTRRHGNGAWCPSSDGLTCVAWAPSTLAPNPDAGVPGLLIQSENGIGGTTYLEYRPSTQWDNDDDNGIPRLPLSLWTVGAIESDDGMCDSFGGNCIGAEGAAHSVRTELRYSHGIYDHGTREFRGFGVVEQLDDAGNLARHEFLQDQARQGKSHVLERFAADAVDPYARPIAARLQLWECADPESGAELPCPLGPLTGRVWTRQSGAQTIDYSNFDVTNAQWTVTARYNWQQCEGWLTGNAGAEALVGPGLAFMISETDYACATARHILDKPIRTAVLDETGAAKLQETWFFYDADAAGNPLPYGQIDRGNVSRSEAWLDTAAVELLPPPCTAAPAKACARATTKYDAIGNVIEKRDANGHAISIEYSAASHFLYPAVTTNALGHKVGTHYSVACGQLEWQTRPYTDSAPVDDPSHARSKRRYDSFCRLERTANGDEDLDTSPNQVLLYALGAAQLPTVMTVFTREPHYSETHDPSSPAGQALPDPSYLPAWTLTDALGRPIQRQRRAVIDGEPATVAGVTMSYDARGLLSRQYVPFSGAGSGVFSPPQPSVGYRELAYDAIARLERQTNPDGGVRRWDHSVAWQTAIEDECYVDPSCAGGKTVETRDFAGRVVEKQLWDESTSNPLAAKSRYTYDNLGRLLTSEQWNGADWDARTRIVHEYDSLGRRVSLDDPDSGLWQYGYDPVGNLRWQDDPQPDQHLQFCYDHLDRVARKYVFSNVDFPQAFLSCAFGATVEYTYDDADDPNGIGRLAVVDDPSGSTWFQYDLRGRLLSVNKAIQVDREPPAADDPAQWGLFIYTYDAGDHVTSIRYPDGEIVAHGYDSSGQLNRLESDSGKVYLNDLTYDIFGRRRRIVHGDGSVDERTYGGKENGYRLRSITTSSGSTRHLDLSYSAYTREGMIKRIDDLAYPGSLDARSGTVTYDYDGAGRLVRATGNNLPAAPNDSYDYDVLGNMVRKQGRVLTYDPTRPHQLKTIDGLATGIAHDANGNRLGKPGRTYEYDHEGRLANIDGGLVNFQYDYTGRQVAKVTGELITRYYNELAETRGNVLVKHYFAGDLRVASLKRPSWQAAAAPGGKPTMLALAGSVNTLVIATVAELAVGAGATAAFGILVLAGAPGRGRRRMGLIIRREQVLLAIGVWALGTLPLPSSWRPLGARPATAGKWSICYNCVPTPTPVPQEVEHTHLDHLGSAQLVTRGGGVVHHIRYDPFGRVRGRYDGAGAALGSPGDAYEFTGYESDAASGLQYAGARFYDPELGLFLTHDPRRQFPSPYAYGSWNPVNGVDPDGEFFFLVPVIAAIVEAVTAVVAAVQAALAALLPHLETVVVAAAKGAAKGAAGGLLKGSIEALVSGDADAIVDGLKNGAVTGAVSGLLFDASGLGEALDSFAGETQLSLADFTSPSADFVGKAATAGLNGTLAGSFKGAVSGAAKNLVLGGDAREDIGFGGFVGGAIGGAFGNLIQPAIDEISLAAVSPITHSIADTFGLSPSAIAPTGGFRSVVDGGLLRSTAGGALTEAHKGVGNFLNQGLSRRGEFDPRDLASGIAKGAGDGTKAHLERETKLFYDHHIKPVVEGIGASG